METIQHLKQQLEDWEDMQGIDEEEDEQEWIQAGINLYEKCIEVDKENKSEYLQILSKLYLNLGRNEKMNSYNFGRALRNLRQATYIDSKDPRPCYHLSFLLEKQSNYEGSLFYAERAIKLGLDNKQIFKLYCNMALCYFKLFFFADAYKYLTMVEERAKVDAALLTFLRPYQAKINAARKKGYVPLSQQQATLIETEEEIENSVSKGERVVLMIHPYQTELNGEMESVSLSSVNTKILEAVILSKEGLSISDLAYIVWEHNAIEMSDSYVPRMINKIRSDIKKATGIDGKLLLRTVDNKYVWDHVRLRGSVHYKNIRRINRGSREGITIL